MQLLAKFKKILYMGFRANLNFRKSIFPHFFAQNIVNLIVKHYLM